MAANAWLSVLARRGVTVVYPRTIKCCQWTDTFGMVIKSVGFEEDMVSKVQISNNERFQGVCHFVELTSPVLLCEQFHCQYVCYDLFMDEQLTNKKVSETRNAFTILMDSQRMRSLPAKGELTSCSDNTVMLLHMCISCMH